MAQQLLETPAEVHPPGGPGIPDFGGGDGDSGRPSPEGAPIAHAGVWLLLGAVTMLFLGFTSTYLARRTGSDWTPVSMPGILWFSTAVLVLSSGVLEWGRSGFRRGDGVRLQPAVNVATLLGILFVLGQLAAWRQLAAAGVFLASNPHASFFYVLTAVHAAHVLAGLGWLIVGAVRLRHHGPTAARAVTSGAIYWHFVGVLWIYLWVLLFWI
ncbi:cytochrome c oxidase subunit 3 [Limnochorda pilosa]|uniref:Cytochrome C oxidase subunit III n=1 Tax=Limnochorda pilosa TaxID=1555112 RepID=A0A0K2SFT0_LIMPI|nr:cytochrome c oxidase subunit 3 [Limnochorda pilosa]BAS25961.1 cytochrome C oxidase subunit III [Limnochorda pilosa]